MLLHRSMLLFALITLMPVVLLAAGAVWGGVWIWGALIYLTGLTFLLDQLVPLIAPNAPPGAEFPAANGLSVALALAHLVLLVLGVWAVSGGSGLPLADRCAGFLGFGLFFGQVSNSNAHELIHRGSRGLFRLGALVFTSLLFGHHTSAHRLVHHAHVATPDDPNSARLGESYYRFAPRAWIGSFRAGLAAENRRRAASNKARGAHPYLFYVLGGLAFVIAATLIFGLPGLAAYLALAVYAQAQLLLSDYVQHYGLTRAPRAGGGFAPVSDLHSWNAPHWFSGYLMLNAPRHSDHHANPSRIYPALRQAPEMPTLPLGLPAMATLALFPRRWRRVMDKRVRRWQVPADLT